VAASIAYFVSLEVSDLIDVLVRIGFLPTGWPGAVIAMLRMEMVIYMTAKTFGAMKPRTGADENATGEPLRAIVAVGGAVVGRDVIVTIGTIRSNSNVDADLSLRFGCS
jgi:hypothetical protein